MRSVFVLALLLLFPASASAKPKELTAQRFARGIAKAISKADAEAFEACCHPEFWSAPQDSGQLLFKQLTAQGLEVELDRREQRVVGERSLLPLELSKGGQALGDYVLRIEYTKDRWGISAADEPKPEHEEWLAGGLKQGSLETPAEAVEALIKAIAGKDKPAARLHATESSWHEPGDTLFSLYRQAVKKELVLSAAKAPVVKDSRAVALVDISRKGRVVDQVVLYLVKRSAGWLIAAIDEDEAHGLAYLDGRAAAKVWPSSPSRLGYAFGAWRESRQGFRSLWSEAGWTAAGKSLYERLGAKLEEVTTGAGDRDLPAAGRVLIVVEVSKKGSAGRRDPSKAGGAEPAPALERLYLQAENSPAGWRFTGTLKDAAAGKAWQAGE